MQVHNLKPKKKKKEGKRIGRGGNRGSFSGKGVKGQKKRAGGTTRAYKKELILKFPKLRGVKNKSVTPDAEVINVGRLENYFKKNNEVTRQSLLEKGIISKNTKAVKILGDGEISIPLTIKNVPASKTAQEKIEQAGGEIIS